AYSFAGSQQLAQQLGQGAEADVFASANNKQMTAVVDAGRVDKDAPQVFVKNRLVVIYPKDNPAGLTELKDLANPGIKLDLGDQSVPVGQYSVDFLDKAVENPDYGASFKDDVLKNVVSYEDNVKAVVTKVSLGEADAGIVYLTDITADAADKVGMMDIPDDLNTIATYPIATVSDSKNADLADAFVAFILSPDGQQVMANYGFVPAAPSASSAGGSFTVSDALGREITFEQAPQRIVLAGKALFMVADAIYLFPEAGQNIVALGSTGQGSGNFIPMIDPTFADKISLASDAGAEQIAAAQPDCVIMKSSNAEKLGKPLEELKIPVVYLDFETPDQYERDLATLGQLFQNPDRAAEVATFYQGKVDSISQTVSSLTDDQKPRTLILYYNEKDGAIAFNVPPLSWMQTLIVQSAGGAPVWADANPVDSWTKVSLEQVAAWNPDIIFIVAYFNPVDDVVASLKVDPQWQALDAVKNDKIFGFATDVYSWDQPDTRWILGLTWMAGKLHPDLFPDLDMVKEAQTFYQELYGIDEATFQKDLQPLMSGDIN
ncbi:MAG: molybdate ABC transporter substrate-binding protein, partial [Chloroflexi bacterium]|nr:molybdate ABC transporter substrate-binding protein [Chloroflexota bacterium]